MSPGGAPPPTVPAVQDSRPAEIRAPPSSPSRKSSSTGVPASTANTHQVTWSWIAVSWPWRHTKATIENEPSGSTWIGRET